jgi:hypothetical protein
VTRYEWLKQLVEYLKQNPTDECVEWPFPKLPNGYGQLGLKYHRLLAHRVAFALYHDKEPGPYILHICANPACVNPGHLYEGTAYENMRDTVVAATLGIDGIVPPDKIKEAKVIIERQRRSNFDGLATTTKMDKIRCRVKILSLIRTRRPHLPHSTEEQGR